MTEDRWDRLMPLTGIAAVGLWLAGIVVLEGVADTPADDAPASAFAAYYEDESGAIVGGSILFLIGSLLFMWFLGSVRAAFNRAEGGIARFTAIAFAGGLATAVFSMAIVGPDVAGAIIEDIEPAAAQALRALSIGFFVLMEFAAALFLAASAVVALRTRVLPRWLAWVTLAIVVILLIPHIGWAALAVLFPLWIVLVSVLLFQRQGTVPAPAGEAT